MSGHHNPELVATLEAERAHKPRRVTGWTPRIDTAETIAARRELAKEIANYAVKSRAKDKQ